MTLRCVAVLLLALAFGCSSDAPGICAEGNGNACTCADGTAGIYDCSHDCVCGTACAPLAGESCACDGAPAGTVDCDGACGCPATADMSAELDLSRADQGRPDAGVADVEQLDMSSDDRVMIAAGTYTMGCMGPGCAADEGPTHDVTLSPYWIDRTEVSQSGYQACIDGGACTAPATAFDPATTGAYPVVSVTYTQAQEYCAWAGGRLPTEAEWERACTGGDARVYPWGDETPTCDLANTMACGAAGANAVSPVDGAPGGASAEGALNLAGNVWEWTADWYAADAYAQHDVQDPVGPVSGTERVYRGGSSGNDASLARCRNRANTYNPDVGGTGLGFRCAY